MEVVLSSVTEYGERYKEKELLGEGGFGKVTFSCKQMMAMMMIMGIDRRREAFHK